MGMIFKSCFLWLFCSLISIQAASLNSQQSLAKFQEFGLELQKRSNVSLEFEQETFRSIRKKTRKSRGKAQFAKPNKLRWTLLEPTVDEWIFDGRTLYHHQANIKQATSYHMTSGRSKEFRNLVNMVLDTNALIQEFNILSGNSVGQSYEFQLKPKKNNSNVKKMSVRYDSVQHYLNLVVMEFEGGNKTTFRFSNPSYHQVSAKNFSLPQSVKVVKGL